MKDVEIAINIEPIDTEIFEELKRKVEVLEQRLTERRLIIATF